MKPSKTVTKEIAKPVTKETAKTTNNYAILKDEITECLYCNALVNLYNMKNHMKGKTCQEMKELYIQANEDKPNIEINYKLYLNKLRKKALRGEDDEDEK